MIRNFKIGFFIFCLVVLTNFHRGESLECYVCEGEDNCAKEELDSQICGVVDSSSTETPPSEATTPSTTTSTTPSTTSPTSPSTTASTTGSATPSTTASPIPSTSPSTTPSETSSTDSSETSSTDPSETSSTDPSEASSTDTSTSSSTTPSAPSENEDLTPSDYSVYLLTQGKSNLMRRKRSALLTPRAESWSCYQSVKDGKVVERGCTDNEEDSDLNLCKTDNCNPATSIHSSFILIFVIFTVTIISFF